MIMKSLLVASVLLLTLVAGVRAQTNSAASETAAKPDTTKADTAKTDAAKPEASGQTAKPAEPYPVTAIVESNTITFPVLLSSRSEPLMTNAVYRRTFGRKVIFAADLSVKSFDIDKLHPSVIAQLDLDTNKVKADQETLDKQNQDRAAQRQQQTQQALSAEAAALAKSQAAAQAAATNGGPPAPGAPGNGQKHSGKHKGAPQTPPPAN
jgi:hypothetical protein